MTSWFLGPKGENAAVWRETLDHIFTDYVNWRRNYFPSDPIAVPRSLRRLQAEWLDDFDDQLDIALSHLKAHFPFYSPRYIAHMLSETSLPAVAGYFAGMLYNPNNVTDEAAPVTVGWEIEVGSLVSEMLGYDPDRAWGHLTSGGTLANTEALWVARQVQFAPLAMQEFCVRNEIDDFTVRFPGRSRQIPLVDVEAADLLNMDPEAAVGMPRGVARHLAETRQIDGAEAIAAVNTGLGDSTWNPARVGVGPIVERLGKQPMILVSEAAHYSIAKAANLLGYGEDAVVTVPVDRRFRLDIEQLDRRLDAIPDDRYLAAVVAVIGTTEEGAVDPINEIAALRQSRQMEHHRSFWIHADAAWGGYFATLLRGLDLAAPGTEAANYLDAMEVEETVEINTAAPRLSRGDPQRLLGVNAGHKTLHLGWGEDLIEMFLWLKEADSITVDPHKMGYVPYPAGVVCYRDRTVTEHITQRAQYISDHAGGITDFATAPAPDAVGPYIIEGSKPGAAALAVWLTHTTIPLDRGGHGKLIKTSILNAKKLHRYLANHHEFFWDLVEPGSEKPTEGFSFVPLCDPDTNIVCFVVVPRRVAGARLEPSPCSLAQLNRLNRAVYEVLSVPASGRGEVYPYGQEFFASRTTLEARQYGWDVIRQWLELLEIGEVSEEQYREHGVFVLRSTVMNPFYYPAEAPASTRLSRDYLMDFVNHLHRVAATVIERDRTLALFD
jgi:glutamate/tyrosine decarboxylase-like PLP-dependent enzyme